MAVCTQEDTFFLKYKELDEALVGVVEEYSLVSFLALDIQVWLIL